MIIRMSDINNDNSLAHRVLQRFLPTVDYDASIFYDLEFDHTSMCSHTDRNVTNIYSLTILRGYECTDDGAEERIAFIVTTCNDAILSIVVEDAEGVQDPPI